MTVFGVFSVSRLLTLVQQLESVVLSGPAVPCSRAAGGVRTACLSILLAGPSVCCAPSAFSLEPVLWL